MCNRPQDLINVFKILLGGLTGRNHEENKTMSDDNIKMVLIDVRYEGKKVMPMTHKKGSLGDLCE